MADGVLSSGNKHPASGGGLAKINSLERADLAKEDVERTKSRARFDRRVSSMLSTKKLSAI